MLDGWLSGLKQTGESMEVDDEEDPDLDLAEDWSR
jgi:hypothetical protein